MTGFPEKIVQLNEILETSMFADRNFQDVYQVRQILLTRQKTYTNSNAIYPFYRLSTFQFRTQSRSIMLATRKTRKTEHQPTNVRALTRTRPALLMCQLLWAAQKCWRYHRAPWIATHQFATSSKSWSQSSGRWWKIQTCWRCGFHFWFRKSRTVTILVCPCRKTHWPKFNRWNRKRLHSSTRFLGTSFPERKLCQKSQNIHTLRTIGEPCR